MLRAIIPLILFVCVALCIAACRRADNATTASVANVEEGLVEARACAPCHGIYGRGTGKGPWIAGLAKEDIEVAATWHRHGTTDHSEKIYIMMRALTSSLNREGIDAVATYYASLR